MKVYTLKDGDWEEVSTGHVTIQLLDAITLLVIRSEIDGLYSIIIKLRLINARARLYHQRIQPHQPRTNIQS